MRVYHHDNADYLVWEHAQTPDRQTADGTTELPLQHFHDRAKKLDAWSFRVSTILTTHGQWKTLGMVRGPSVSLPDFISLWHDMYPSESLAHCQLSTQLGRSLALCPLVRVHRHNNVDYIVWDEAAQHHVDPPWRSRPRLSI